MAHTAPHSRGGCAGCRLQDTGRSHKHSQLCVLWTWWQILVIIQFWRLRRAVHAHELEERRVPHDSDYGQASGSERLRHVHKYVYFNRNVCLAAGWRIWLISRIWCISRPIHANALDEWWVSWTATRHGSRTKLWAAPAAFSRAHTRGKGSLIRRYCCCNPHASQGAADDMLHGGVLAPLLHLDCFALLFYVLHGSVVLLWPCCHGDGS